MKMKYDEPPNPLSTCTKYSKGNARLSVLYLPHYDHDFKNAVSSDLYPLTPDETI